MPNDLTPSSPTSEEARQHMKRYTDAQLHEYATNPFGHSEAIRAVGSIIKALASDAQDARASCSELRKEAAREASRYAECDDAKTTAEIECSELRTLLQRAEEAKDGAYRERDQLVAALSKLFPASLERHPDTDTTWDNDWRWIVFIDIPVREYLTYGDQRNGPGPHFRDTATQVTWHIHDSELPQFAHLPRNTGRIWDGHSTPEKYERLRRVLSTSPGDTK